MVSSQTWLWGFQEGHSSAVSAEVSSLVQGQWAQARVVVVEMEGYLSSQ